MLGYSEGKRRGWQRTRLLDSITNSMDTNLNNLQETVEDRGAQHATVHWVTLFHTTIQEQYAISLIQQTFKYD